MPVDFRGRDVHERARRRVGRFAGRLDSFFAGQHFGDFRGRRFAARDFQVTDRFDVRRRFAFVLDDHLVFDGFRRRDDPFKRFRRERRFALEPLLLDDLDLFFLQFDFDFFGRRRFVPVDFRGRDVRERARASSRSLRRSPRRLLCRPRLQRLSGRRFAARDFQVTDRFDVRRRFAFVLDDHLVFDGFRRRDDPFKLFRRERRVRP